MNIGDIFFDGFVGEIEPGKFYFSLLDPFSVGGFICNEIMKNVEEWDLDTDDETLFGWYSSDPEFYASTLLEGYEALERFEVSIQLLNLGEV